MHKFALLYKYVHCGFLLQKYSLNLSLVNKRDFKYVNILSDCFGVYTIIATLIPIFIHFKQKTSSIKITTCHENDKVDVRDNLYFFLENINES